MIFFSHENEVIPDKAKTCLTRIFRDPGSSGLFAWAGGWIPAFAGMTSVMILSVFSVFLPSPVHAETITVSSFDHDFCKDVVGHVPSPDVEYRPGEEPGIVPPDVAGSVPMALPRDIEFPMTIDLARSFGLDVPPGMEMTAPLGTFKITHDGHVLFNGQDLSDRARAYCADGQEAQDVIKSQAPEPDRPERTGNEELYGAYPNDSDASPAETGQTENGH